jgi:hypothetical protein
LSDFLEQVRDLIGDGEVRISEHAYDELVEDTLTVREVIAGVQDALVVEEYLDYPKGPCTLLLQQDQLGQPIHVVWGIPKGYNKPAVLVTAYRPSLDNWDNTFLKRRD